MKKVLIISLISLSLLTACTAGEPEELTKVTANYKSQINSEGMVTIEVTPQVYNNQQWVFDLNMGTHSIDLDYDLAKLATLTDASGVVYENPVWGGDPAEGHHRQGQLIFSGVSNSLDFTLNIQDVAGVDNRIFIWETTKE